VRGPRRIIALAPSNAEIVWELGAGKRLVGVSPYVTYPSELQGIAKIGGLHDPDMETILGLQPDLLLMRGANVHLENLCKSQGIGLYYDRTDSLNSIFTTIEELGEALKLEAKAAELAGSVRQRLENVRGPEESNRPRVLLTVRIPERLSTITTVGRGSYLHELVEWVGGENIFGDMDVLWPEVRLEEVVARRPDIIIEAMPNQKLDGGRREELIEQWRALGTLDANVLDRIHFITEDYALIPSHRVALMAERLSALIASRDDSRGE
jgi:iron complex transport system substrate-binding protein